MREKKEGEEKKKRGEEEKKERKLDPSYPTPLVTYYLWHVTSRGVK
jgi:hypothetical protein